ncbi:MAG: DNA polymerase/3'-5' exonuclease PolX [Chloroflexi bacterium]|nr:DNA polymerase/3'-5' exonuclease PolX [Chloroflexota bacterium]
MSNAEISEILNRIAELLEIKGESRYRIYAYQRAAEAIASEPVDARTLMEQGRLENVPGIGKSIAAKITELLKTGHLKYYEDLQAGLPSAIVHLMEVPGIGPKTAMRLYNELGITSVAELEAAARAGRISGLPGYGPKTEENILRDVHNLRLHEERRLLGEVLPVVADMIAALRSVPGIRNIVPAGSIRRMEETVGDIDLVATAGDPAKAVQAFVKLPQVREVLGQGPTKATVVLRNGIQADIRVVPDEAFGSLLQHFTGNKAHNIILREYAKSKGYSISEYGITDLRTGTIKPYADENEVYESLGLQPMPPEIRLGTNEIERAARHDIPRLVTLADIKGDLHVHSDWSDGVASIEDLARGAKAMGYEYIAICDHSASLAIANGLSAERLRKQIDTVRRLNEADPSFRILTGIEANIRGDGTVEVPEELLGEIDVVVASIHSGLSQSSEKITTRLTKAIHQPFVAVIGHPTGRILGHREPSMVDLGAIFAQAAGQRTAMEINGIPDRLDLRDVQARQAMEAGAILSTNSDAHSVDQLSQMLYAVAVARRGWLEARHILNTKPLGELLEWLRARRK